MGQQKEDWPEIYLNGAPSGVSNPAGAWKAWLRFGTQYSTATTGLLGQRICPEYRRDHPRALLLLLYAFTSMFTKMYAYMKAMLNPWRPGRPISLQGEIYASFN